MRWNWGAAVLLALGCLVLAGKVPQWVEDNFQEATKHIDFLHQDTFQQTTAKGVWIVFFGAVWCPHCKLLTPRWREFQDTMRDEMATKNIFIRKVECTENQDLCEGDQEIFGFPTIRLFRDGKFVEEIDAPDKDLFKEAGNYMIQYAKDIAQQLESGTFDSIREERKAKAAAAAAQAEELKKQGEEGKEIPPPPPPPSKSKEELIEQRLVLQEREAAAAAEAALEKDLEFARGVAEKFAAPASGANPAGEIVHLTDKNFKDLSAESDWFVMFHAPWCGHCKNLAPTWEKLAEKFKGKLNIGKVDCTKETGLASKYGIKGYPTLKYISAAAGSAVDFTGRRDINALSQFVAKFQSPVFDVIKALDIGDAVHKPYAVFYIYDPLTLQPSYLENFAKVASSLRQDASFYVTPDHAALSRLGLDPLTPLPAVVVSKDGGTERKAYVDELSLETAASRSELKTWILNNKRPLVARLDQGTSTQILSGENLVVLGILNAESTHHAEETALLRHTAKEWYRKLEEAGKRAVSGSKRVSFAWLDGFENRQYIEKVYKLASKDLPRVIVVEPKLDMYYDAGKDGNAVKFDTEPIIDHIVAVLKGEVKAKASSSFLSTTILWLGHQFNMAILFALNNPFIFMAVLFTIVGLGCYWFMTPAALYQPVPPRGPKAE